MKSIFSHHLGVLRAQSSVLSSELRQLRHSSSSDTSSLYPADESQVLPPLLKKRYPDGFHGACRVVDDFDLTLMYLLDENGKISETNRLETFMIVMANIPGILLERRVFCMYIFHHHISDAMKVCFMDSGGLRLFENWIQDCVLDALSNFDFILLFVEVLRTLPSLAFTQRNISKCFFEKALMPLAKSIRVKALKGKEGFEKVYNELKQEYARVFSIIKEKEEGEELEKRKQEEKLRQEQEEKERIEKEKAEKEKAEMQELAKKERVEMKISNKEDSEAKKSKDEIGQQEESLPYETYERDCSAPEVESTSEAVMKGQSIDMSRYKIDNFSTYISKSRRSSPRHVQTSSSGIDVLDNTMLAYTRSSSSANSPRTTSSSLSLPPPLPFEDFTKSEKPLKSILKKKGDYAKPAKSVAFGGFNFKSVCSWYGGTESYFQWQRPSELNFFAFDIPSVDSEEALCQEDRLKTVVEYSVSESQGFSIPHDPGNLRLGMIEEADGHADVIEIPWIPVGEDEHIMDELPTEAYTESPESAEEEEKDKEESTFPFPTGKNSYDSFDEEVNAPKSAFVVANDRCMYRAIWLIAKEMVCNDAVALSKIGSKLVSTFGKKYLSKCGGKNLKKVLESHPHERFVFDEDLNVQTQHLSDIWEDTEYFIRSQQFDGPLLLSSLQDMLSDQCNHTLKTQALSLQQALLQHPLHMFKILDADQGFNFEPAVCIVSEPEPETVAQDIEPKSSGLEHMAQSLYRGVDPYLDQDDSEDDDSVGEYDHGSRSFDSSRTEFSNSDDLKDILLHTLVEQIKARGVVGLRITQMNAALALLYYEVTRGYKPVKSHVESARAYIAQIVQRKFPHVYMQEQRPSGNHCLYYIDNPSVSSLTWEQEVSCIYLPQLAKKGCPRDDCKFAHVRVYDDVDRGFSDSTDKRMVDADTLMKQILEIIEGSGAVVYNFQIFEMYYAVHGCRLSLGKDVTICQEADVLNKMLLDQAQVRAYTHRKCSEIRVLAYIWAYSGFNRSVSSYGNLNKRKLTETVSDTDFMSRDKLFRLLKEFGRRGIRLQDIPSKYYEKYGENCCFTIGGEINVDLETVLCKIPGIRRATPLDSEDMQDFNRSSAVHFGSRGMRWGAEASNPDGDDEVFYYDESVSYLDEDGCLNPITAGKTSKSKGYEYGNKRQGYTESNEPEHKKRRQEEEDVLGKRGRNKKRDSQPAHQRAANNPSSSKSKKMCIYYNTPKGCRKGDSCPFAHRLY